EGVFLTRANSPSAASKMDFTTKKNNAAHGIWFRILIMAANPDTMNVKVICTGVKAVFFKNPAIHLAIGLPKSDRSKNELGSGSFDMRHTTENKNRRRKHAGQ
ncbi:hypothetical protein LCGC14_3030940, partial [marine sediment metagenome]